MRPATHPLERWPRRHRAAFFAGASALAILTVVLSVAVAPLHEDEPGGESIVAFELAGSVDRAEEILATWRAEGVVDEAKAIQLYDLVYPVIYAVAIAGGCLAAAGAWRRYGRVGLARLGATMAWIALAAAAFDYVENLGLAVSLWDEPASPWPQLALIAAILKFGCSGASLLYAISGAVPALAVRSRS